jgi:hypothetical protein
MSDCQIHLHSEFAPGSAVFFGILSEVKSLGIAAESIPYGVNRTLDPSAEIRSQTPAVNLHSRGLATCWLPTPKTAECHHLVRWQGMNHFETKTEH